MNIVYRGDDGYCHLLGDTLQHWKYIKKIGNRYFYTMEALQAYYQAQRKVEDARFVKDAVINERQRQQRDATLRNERAQTINLIKNDKSFSIAQGNGKFREATHEERVQTIKSLQSDYKRRKRMNEFLDRMQDRYLTTRRIVNPVAKTAKRAVTPIETPKDRLNKAKKKIKRKRTPIFSHDREITVTRIK